MRKQPGLELSVELERALSRNMKEVGESPPYPYPWHGLEADLVQAQRTWFLRLQ